MSIFRSGVMKPVLLKCLRPVKGQGFECLEGQTYELVVDIGSMYVVKFPSGLEAAVPKDSFKVAEEPKG